MTIVLCSKGYQEIIKNSLINNLEKIKLKNNEVIYHAGTKINHQKIFSNGGRVLNFTAVGQSYLSIRKRLIYLIKKLNWKNGFFRKDIGWRVINKKENHKEILKAKNYYLSDHLKQDP